jgi:hypothetical protein
VIGAGSWDGMDLESGAAFFTLSFTARQLRILMFLQLRQAAESII